MTPRYKYQEFTNSQTGNCIKHGTHSEWSLYLKQKKYPHLVCLQCARECDRLRDPVKKKLIGAKSHSKRINRDFEISYKFIKELIRAQNYKCALTGIEFKEDLTNASIDRIDSLKGYLKTNVQIVLTEINLMKKDLTQEEFKSLCKAVSERTSINGS